MKKLIVLAGNSSRNKEWGEECLSAYRDLFDEAEMLYYNHWESGAEFIDIPAEIEKLKLVIEKTTEAQIYVFAKSIGSILTLVAKHQTVLNPVKAVFFGMPFSVIPKNIYEEALSNFNAQALAFHNDNDPTANYDFSKGIISKNLPTIEIKTISGNTHDYLDFGDYRSDITFFLNS